MTVRTRRPSRAVEAARARFLDFYPDGFADDDYLALERGYKWDAHRRWIRSLDRATFAARRLAGDHEAIAREAVRIEATTNLLFSFEKIAVREAVSTLAGARVFADGLFDWLWGTGPAESRFARWHDALAGLPRRQTRVVTWPVATCFGFIARPRTHLLLKPMVTRRAAVVYGYDLHYRPAVRWPTYDSLLGFARVLRADLADWAPRDMIDVQSFIWVLGSGEYD